MVGDDVEISVIDENEKTGNVDEILQRKSALIRPAVANIDMALVIFAVDAPKPNLNLLDRFLCMMEFWGIPCEICFNKSDLSDEAARNALGQIYEPTGYPVLFTSAKRDEGLSGLLDSLMHKTSAVAGPSGVGKSSLINRLLGEERMQTGVISRKIARGKHTTRHSEILPIAEDTYIMDTPGFGSMDLTGIPKESLRNCFPEFRGYEPQCRFAGCSHIGEPDCGVKEALLRGEIAQSRYDNYLRLYEECKNASKY